MNKGIQFWLDLWEQGRIPFHKEEVQPDLIFFDPQLNLRPKSTVLVPLCGKSKDMLWFTERKHYVVGIELSEQAVLQFFHENLLPFTKEIHNGTKKYYADFIEIWVADIFTLNSGVIPTIDAIYDRAALIALPQKKRAQYATLCLNWLSPEGILFLKTISYDQGIMQGPPYSVSPEEVHQLYAASTVIQCLDSSTREQVGEGDSNLMVEAYLWRMMKLAKKK